MESLKTLAVVIAHLLGIGAFGIVLYDQKNAGEDVCCGWQTPGLHPVLMMFAFVWIGPWGALAYKTYETILGLSHFKAKTLHFILQTLALGQGLLGFMSKYTAGEDNELLHFRSNHSQIGLVVIVLYVIQWLVGFLTFVLPACSRRTKKNIRPVHAFLGSVALCLTVVAVATGVVAYRGFVTDPGGGRKSYDTFCTASFLTALMAILIAAVFSMKSQANDEGISESKPLINDKKNIGTFSNL